MAYIDISTIAIPQDLPMRKAIEIIDTTGLKIALVTDADLKLIGIVTDGDIRRALLAGHTLDTPVNAFMMISPKSAKFGTEKSVLVGRLRKEQILHLPLIDDTGILRDLAYLPAFEQIPQSSNPVVIMAGGLGSRLRPLTETIPKPLVSVAGRPIVDTIVDNLVSQGFNDITFCVNYLGNMLEDHLGHGSRYGANFTFIHEQQRMGTAGALTLLPTKPTEPFFVMNGDILTDINFNSMLDFHKSSSAMATIAANNYTYEVPFGVIEVSNRLLTALTEKPKHNFLVNAGIYLLEPPALQYLPVNEFFDMTSLFERLVAHRQPVAVFPIREQWIDVGRPEDLSKANRLVEKMRDL